MEQEGQEGVGKAVLPKLGTEDGFERGKEVELLEEEEVFFRWRDGDDSQKLEITELKECNGAKSGLIDALHRAQMVEEVGHRLLVFGLDGCSDSCTHAQILAEQLEYAAMVRSREKREIPHQRLNDKSGSFQCQCGGKGIDLLPEEQCVKSNARMAEKDSHAFRWLHSDLRN